MARIVRVLSRPRTQIGEMHDEVTPLELNRSITHELPEAGAGDLFHYPACTAPDGWRLPSLTGYAMALLATSPHHSAH